MRIKIYSSERFCEYTKVYKSIFKTVKHCTVSCEMLILMVTMTQSEWDAPQVHIQSQCCVIAEGAAHSSWMVGLISLPGLLSLFIHSPALSWVCGLFLLQLITGMLLWEADNGWSQHPLWRQPWVVTKAITAWPSDDGGHKALFHWEPQHLQTH